MSVFVWLGEYDDENPEDSLLELPGKITILDSVPGEIGCPAARNLVSMFEKLGYQCEFIDYTDD
ncbi:MAG: hypothetical protein R3C11_04860 [Planctomycetaceae bacterium]